MKLKNLNNITFGEFIDLENIIKSGDTISVAKLLWEGEGDVGDIKLNVLLGGNEKYILFREKIYKNYAHLFEGSDDEDDTNDRMLEHYGIKKDMFDLNEGIEDSLKAKEDREYNRVWGWYVVANNLAGGDFLRINEVFKRPLISVLNHLVYLNNK